MYPMIKVTSVKDATDDGPIGTVVRNIATLNALDNAGNRRRRLVLPVRPGGKDSGDIFSVLPLDGRCGRRGGKDFRYARLDQFTMVRRPITAARKSHNCLTYFACCSAFASLSATEGDADRVVRPFIASQRARDQRKSFCCHPRNTKSSFNPLQRSIFSSPCGWEACYHLCLSFMRHRVHKGTVRTFGSPRR